MEYLTQHISVEWLNKHSIMLIHVKNTARTDLDVYIQWLSSVLNTWERPKPFLIGYDLSKASFTPYASHIAIRVGKMMPTDLIGKTAIILPQTLVISLFSQFFNRYVPVTNSNMQRQLFQEYEPAIEWLEQGISDPKISI